MVLQKILFFLTCTLSVCSLEDFHISKKPTTGLQTSKAHGVSKEHQRSSPRKDLYSHLLSNPRTENQLLRVIRDTSRSLQLDMGNFESGHDHTKSSHGQIEHSDEDITDHLLRWVLEYFEVLNNKSSNGCVNNNHNHSHVRLKGTAKEGKPCGFISGSGKEHVYTHCAPFEPDSCSKPTFLFCASSDDDPKKKICRRLLVISKLVEFLIYKETDNKTGCLRTYKKSREIPPQLQGKRHFRQSCDPAGLSHETQCKWYTQSLRDESDTNTEKESCLKPTHLYCNALLKICLCGQDQDPNQFQNDKNSHKCYIRPTYDYVEGYECAPGTAPGKVETPKGELNICKCLDGKERFYAPWFNSTDPNWWKCSAVSTSPSTLLLIFALIVNIFKGKQ